MIHSTLRPFQVIHSALRRPNLSTLAVDHRGWRGRAGNRRGLIVDHGWVGGVAAVALLLTVGGCGAASTGAGPTPGATSSVTLPAGNPEPCRDLPRPDPGVRLPDPDFPLLAGAVLYRAAEQGRTQVRFATRPGEDVVETQRLVVAQLTAAGYRTETDAEPPAEAEVQFSGPAEGGVRITPLCDGQQEVRYLFRG